VADLARLVVRLEAESLKYKKELDASQKKLSRFERTANKATSNIGKAAKAGGVAIAAASVAAVAGFAAIVNKQRDLIDQNAKLATSIGGTVAGIQALERAANRAGVSKSELGTAVTRVNQALGTAILRGGKAADALEKLGLRAEDLSRMDVDKRFAAIANRMKDLNLNTQIQAALLRDLGIRQSSVIVLMQGGGAAIEESRKKLEKWGVALSQTESRSIEDANDALAEIGIIFDGLQKKATTRVAPAIRKIADEFLNVIEKAGGMGDIVEKAAGVIVAGVSKILNVASAIGRVFTITKELIVGTVATGLAQLQRLEAKANEILSMLPDFLGGAKFEQNAKEVGDLAEANFARAELAAKRINDALNEPLAGEKFKQFLAAPGPWRKVRTFQSNLHSAALGQMLTTKPRRPVMPRLSRSRTWPSNSASRRKLLG
jgi:hypothetical protein